MNLANSLTFTRIVISPIFLLLYVFHSYLGISSLLLPYILIFLMVISELSDVLDGYVARKYNQVTDLGKIFDPMADSIYRISIFLTLTKPPVNLPILIVFIFIYRDSIISTLRTICALQNFALAARFSGKLKAVIQAISAFSILLLMIPESLDYITAETLQYYSIWIASVAAIYVNISGIDYLIANKDYIKKLLINQNHAQR